MTTTSGLNAAIFSHVSLIQSSSIFNSVAQSSSFVISTLVWFSPFLYSSEQSNSKIRGLSMRRFMRLGATTSLFIITPRNTAQSSMEPPAIFSTFAYFLMSISFVPSSFFLATHITASSAKFGINSPMRAVNLVPMELLTIFNISSRSATSMGKLMASITPSAASNAFMYARTITVG